MIRAVQCVDVLAGGVFALLQACSSHMTDACFDYIVGEKVTPAQRAAVERLGGEVVADGAATGAALERAVRRAAKGGADTVFHVHRSFRSLEPARLARVAGFRAVAVHAHNVYPPSSALVGFYRVLFRRQIKRYVDVSCACSRASLEQLFGAHPKRPEVIPNPVDVARFRFSDEARARVRAELGLGDRPVVVHCGLPIPQKNHTFLLAVFAELRRGLPGAALLLVGPSEQDAPQLVARCAELGLSRDAVHMVGHVDNVPDLLSAADAVCFPSTNEGVPLALLEAQASGLPVVASKAIDPEVDLFGHMRFVGLDEPLPVWASALGGALREGRHEVTPAMVAATGHGVDACAERLETLYRDLLGMPGVSREGPAHGRA